MKTGFSLYIWSDKWVKTRRMDLLSKNDPTNGVRPIKKTNEKNLQEKNIY